MLRMIVVVALIFGVSANAPALTLAEAKARNAIRLSGVELKQLMPGAKVVERTTAGSTRTWRNKTDGTFVASSDSKGSSVGRALPASGNGTWRVGDKGNYCVTIHWSGMVSEDWCRYIFKVDGKYFGFGRLEGTAQGSEFEFSK